MSTSLETTAQAIKENPELFVKLTSASSAEERAEILREAGLEVPTHADVNARVAAMAGVAGGWSSNPTGVTTGLAVTGGVAVVAAVAAAAA